MKNSTKVKRAIESQENFRGNSIERVTIFVYARTVKRFSSRDISRHPARSERFREPASIELE